MLSIDTLIGTPANGCKIEFRFATIANAAKSPALRSIEAANAEYFFELEDFGGTARQAVDSAIRQIAAEMLPDSVEQTMGTYGSRPKPKLRSRTRSSPILSAGGVSREGRTACTAWNVIPIRWPEETNYPRQTCFPNSSCTAWKPCCARNCTNNTEPTATKSWPLRDSSRNTSPLTENFQVTPEGITFYYNPYDLGYGYALGAVEVTMTREELENL